jgi:hypothetical protein
MSSAVIRKMQSAQGASKAWAVVWDSVLHEDVILPTKVTSDPIASGSPVNDHAYDEQVQLALTVVVSNVPPSNVLNGKSIGQHEQDGDVLKDPYIIPGFTRSQAALARLDEIRTAHELCNVQTGLRYFPNMFLTNIRYSTTTGKSEVLEAELSFVGLNLTRVLVKSYPPRKDVKTTKAASLAKKKNAGAGQAPSTAQQRQAFKKRLISGFDGVVFTESQADAIALERYPDEPGASNLVNGGVDP